MTKPAKYDPKRPLITPRLVEWAARVYGRPGLPYAAENDFRAKQLDYINQGKPRKYLSWVTAFQNYIKWTSPAGQYHNARVWEKWLESAKRFENQTSRAMESKRVNTGENMYHPDPDSGKDFDGYTPKKPESAHVVDAAKGQLQQLLNNRG